MQHVFTLPSISWNVLTCKKKTKTKEKEQTSQRLCFGRGRKLNAEIEQTRFEMSRIRRYLRTVCRTWAFDECRRYVIAKPVSGSTCQSCNSAGRASTDRTDRQLPAAAQTAGEELDDDDDDDYHPPPHHHYFTNRVMVGHVIEGIPSN